MERKSFLFIIFLIFVAPSLVFASSYFVCDNAIQCNAGDGSGWSTGSDSKNGTSKSTPFKTIQKAADVVSAGDTVIVGDGEYTSNGTFIVEMKANGMSDQVITFQSENTHGATLDGGWNSQSDPEKIGFGFFDRSYISVEGFEVTRVSGGFHSNGTASNITIRKNEIHNLGRFLHTSNPCQDNPTSYGIFSGFRTSYWKIDKNKIYDIGRNHSSSCESNGIPTDLKWDHGLYLCGKRHTVTNNIIYNMYAGYWLVMKGYAGLEIKNGEATYTVINNTFAGDTHPYGYAHVRVIESGDYPAQNLIIENNISYNTEGRNFIRWRASIPLSGQIRNNAISGDDILFVDNGIPTGSVIETGNKANLALSSFKMTDPDNHDYSLTAQATELLDAGLYENAPGDDYNGNSRTQDDGPDLGAYEQSRQDQSNNLLEPPENLIIIN